MQGSEIVDMQTVGENIAQLRKCLGYSQEDLADVVGLSRKAIGSIERGESAPRMDTMLQICRELHVTPNELLSADLLTCMDSDQELLDLVTRARALEPDKREQFYQMMDVILKGLTM